MAISKSRQNFSIIIIVIISLVMYGIIKKYSKTPALSSGVKSVESKIMCSTHLLPVIDDVIKIYNEESDEKFRLVYNDAYTLQKAVKRGKIPAIMFTEAEHLVLELERESIIDSSQIKRIFNEGLMLVQLKQNISTITSITPYKTLGTVRTSHLVAIMDTVHTTTGYYTNMLFKEFNRIPGRDINVIQYPSFKAMYKDLNTKNFDWLLISNSTFVDYLCETGKYFHVLVADPEYVESSPLNYYKINCYAIRFNASDDEWTRINSILESDSIKSVYKKHGFRPIIDNNIGK